MDMVMEYLPWIIGVIIAWVVLGLLLKLARAVISIGCWLIAVGVAILILVNIF